MEDLHHTVNEFHIHLFQLPWVEQITKIMLVQSVVVSDIGLKPWHQITDQPVLERPMLRQMAEFRLEVATMSLRKRHQGRQVRGGEHKLLTQLLRTANFH